MTAFNAGREKVIAYPVTVRGVRTRVIEAGSGDRVLVCLHGVGSRADRFVPAVPALVAAGFHVFAIDFPGHGFADKRDGIDYRPQAFAAYVADVLDALHLRDVVIAGTSLGGLVAARIACDRPELVERLVLIGTMGIAPLDDGDKVPPEAVANGTPERVRAKLGFLVADPANVTAAWVREESMINSSEGAHGALLAAAAHLNEEANSDLQTERLHELRPGIPVLLVWGENDRWTPVRMAYIARDLLPGSKLVVMPGCGHAPYFEDPATFVAHLHDFVATPA
ncbi:alpha/beta fold hydrolase [Micromonospora sp. CA-263727]|uniref:alpha/beta fold hydrolase n=1 Tax=Micromonospora sp. CA-263727 TaxID=3239967 RepID=UPI003D8EB1AB